jgi:hypothetical protein
VHLAPRSSYHNFRSVRSATWLAQEASKQSAIGIKAGALRIPWKVKDMRSKVGEHRLLVTSRIDFKETGVLKREEVEMEIEKHIPSIVR